MKCQCKDHDGNRCENEAETESDVFADQMHGNSWWFVASLCPEHAEAFEGHHDFPEPRRARVKRAKADSVHERNDNV